MPLITIEGPALKGVEIKRKLVQDVTRAAMEAYEAYGFPKELMVVFIKELGPENVGIAGELVADKRR